MCNLASAHNLLETLPLALCFFFPRAMQHAVPPCRNQATTSNGGWDNKFPIRGSVGVACGTVEVKQHAITDDTPVGDALVQLCTETRDEQINSEIEAAGAYGDKTGNKEVRRAIKSRAGKAATLERLSMALSLLGLEVVRAGSGGDVVNIYDKLVEDKAAKHQFAWAWKPGEPDTPQEETQDEPETPNKNPLALMWYTTPVTPRVVERHEDPTDGSAENKKEDLDGDDWQAVNKHEEWGGDGWKADTKHEDWKGCDRKAAKTHEDWGGDDRKADKTHEDWKGGHRKVAKAHEDWKGDDWKAATHHEDSKGDDRVAAQKHEEWKGDDWKAVTHTEDWKGDGRAAARKHEEWNGGDWEAVTHTEEWKGDGRTAAPTHEGWSGSDWADTCWKTAKRNDDCIDTRWSAAKKNEDWVRRRLGSRHHQARLACQQRIIRERREWKESEDH